QAQFIEQFDMLENIAEGGTFLLNSIYGPDEIWDHLPRSVQQTIIDKKLKFYVIDAYRVAEDAGMGNRINTVMQTAFFAISNIIPRDEAIDLIKQAIRKTYGKKGEEIVQMNFKAVDNALDHLHEVKVPGQVTATKDLRPPVPPEAPEFVQKVTAKIIAKKGDELPVSAIPADGTWPLGTTKWEKRNVALYVPQWEPDLCIQCGNCSIICPHSAIRVKSAPVSELEQAPAGFKCAEFKGKNAPQDRRFIIQVAVEDCTGCTLCVQACPVKSKTEPDKKALNMVDKLPILEQERENLKFFEELSNIPRTEADKNAVKGVQFLEPYFEYSGACAGCGETPYVRLATALFGDRMVIANATGCSSIYGGNLPTTPYTTDKKGRGPAWNNSLFEDNAEFGLGFRVTLDKQREFAAELLQKLSDQIGGDLVSAILNADQSTEQGIEEQRARITELGDRLKSINAPEARALESVMESLVKRSVWIVGGDGWAYDIGYGGLDHVLASGRDVNILVLDTEVYSNTGGQMSKATPRAAVAKFAAGGKPTGKKDLAAMAMSYGNVYVATVALGTNPRQAIKAFNEAEAYPGPSIIICYCHCIAHGISLANGPRQQELAVKSGHWPLIRYNPQLAAEGKNPLVIDSKEPSIPVKEYAYNETRFKMLARSKPEVAEKLIEAMQEDVNAHWKRLQQMAAPQA
ncbi:MAG: pyruvate:ferredoxin (flavodoxin) oxidoreductase, partial [Lentisphaerae bacterium]